jgi:hypothetical protein
MGSHPGEGGKQALFRPVLRRFGIGYLTLSEMAGIAPEDLKPERVKPFGISSAAGSISNFHYSVAAIPARELRQRLFQ